MRLFYRFCHVFTFFIFVNTQVAGLDCRGGNFLAVDDDAHADGLGLLSLRLGGGSGLCLRCRCSSGGATLLLRGTGAGLGSRTTVAGSAAIRLGSAVLCRGGLCLRGRRGFITAAGLAGGGLTFANGGAGALRSFRCYRSG